MKFRNTYAIVVILLTTMFALSANAQTPSDQYAVQDSHNVRDKNMMRQWSYEKNLTNYPAPKKDNWSLGLKVGASYMSADVRGEMDWGFGINLRKSIGHMVSLRGEVSMGWANGQDWRKSGGFTGNNALNGVIDANVDYTSTAYNFVFYNFKMRYYNANVDAIFNFNNINFYKKAPKWNIYAIGGVGAMLYETKMDVLDESGAMYDYSLVPDLQDQDIKQDALNALENLQDGEYETLVETRDYRSTIGGLTFRPSFSMGVGVAFKISRRVDIALEHRTTLTFDDLMDGQRWEETNTLTSNFDYHHFTSIGFNFRIGKGEDSRWWTNPVDQHLDKIRTTNLELMRSRKDTDGDGVVDAMDQDPHTPKGVKVDVKGMPLDSDNDGISDFKDDEPFSPKGAQVDNAGKSLDSDEDGIPDVFDSEPNSEAGAQVDAKGKTIKTPKGGGGGDVADAGMMLSMINFDYASSAIKADFYPALYNVVRVLEQYPDIKIKVIGHADNRSTDDFNLKLSKERASNTVDFLVNNLGADSSRLILEAVGADNPLIKDLPKTKETKFEDYHHLNRRVEFVIVAN